MVFWQKKSTPSRPATDAGTPPDLLDETLLTLNQQGDALTLRQACEGIHIFGGTGSGKTSGSGKTLALHYLQRGMGGLILTAKNDELDTWQKYAKITGRTADLVVFDPESACRFNFMDYENNRTDKGGGGSLNIVDILLDVGGMDEDNSSQNPFFAKAARRLLTNAVEFCQLDVKYHDPVENMQAHDPQSIQLAHIMELIRSAPRHSSAIDTPKFKAGRCHRIIVKLARIGNESSRFTEEDRHAASDLLYYWSEGIISDGGKDTLNSVIATLSNVTDLFQRGTLHKLFCTTTTTDEKTDVRPEASFNGKIVLINLPIETYRKQGEIAQQIFKTMWQQAIQRRDVIDAETLPCFLWADEAQLFLTKHDQLFMTIARSSRAATVYLTQNYPNYQARLDNQNAIVESLLGNFQTKIFHQNTDTKTNEWASDQIGKKYMAKKTSGGSTGQSEMGENVSHSFGLSEELRHQLLPMEFTTLKKGSPTNDYLVEGIVFSGGVIWADGKNYLRTHFYQLLKPEE